jgi:hypothetical protein
MLKVWRCRQRKLTVPCLLPVICCYHDAPTAVGFSARSMAGCPNSLSALPSIRAQAAGEPGEMLVPTGGGVDEGDRMIRHVDTVAKPLARCNGREGCLRHPETP